MKCCQGNMNLQTCILLIMDTWPVNVYIFIVSACIESKSVIQTQHRFCHEFNVQNHGRIPSTNSIVSCVCSNADPTALLCIWGSAQGIERGLFFIHAPLGQTTLRVGQVSACCTGGDCMWKCFCSVIVLWSVRWWWKEGRRWNPLPAHSLLFSKSTKGAARLNVPIRRTNLYQQYYMPSQHIYCGRVWNLIQVCDVQSSDQKVYISTSPSPKVENFQKKIHYLAGDRTPDPLNQRQTCYHLNRAL